MFDSMERAYQNSYYAVSYTHLSDPNVIVGQDQGLVVRYLMMNNQKKPFNDKKVRQAINYAINKEAYVAVVKNGNSEPGTSVIAPKLQYYKGNDPYPYDKMCIRDRSPSVCGG